MSLLCGAGWGAPDDASADPDAGRDMHEGLERRAGTGNAAAMTDAETLALARRFIDAIEAGDSDAALACYAPDAVIWHNTDEAEQDVAANGRTLRGLIRVTTRRRYADRRVQAFPGGFVHRHVLEAEREDRPALRLPACIVCRVEDGRITRLDEYFDSRALDVWAAPQ